MANGTDDRNRAAGHRHDNLGVVKRKEIIRASSPACDNNQVDALCSHTLQCPRYLRMSSFTLHRGRGKDDMSSETTTNHIGDVMDDRSRFRGDDTYLHRVPGKLAFAFRGKEACFT